MNTLAADEADLERRFGGLRRLYGDAGYARLRTARIGVVGVGGVGSWAVEALARCGVAELLLFDLDHVAESNINRQVQASSGTLGQAKVQALAERIAGIHPACRVHGIEAFVQADNWPGLLPQAVDVLIDACDQSSAKLTLARWALDTGAALVCVGAAGGKRRADAVTVADLAEATHDPLLASLRQRLRKTGAGPQTHQGRFGLRCVFSREAVQRPQVPPADCEVAGPAAAPGSPLACAGYGSTVMVTAAFGMAAAAEAVALLLQGAGCQCQNRAIM
ncbi:tRNA threonylcarbamoyladenosine dehydratase [Pseudorhodoferax sp.]|uniref:tRNA threonylcarbamoyladenosine dehydratase n=1 Tax=Pseudorhodoferax sp. TaxID=1993553 RepID=UPI002DD6A1BA|nr:tRNA threonylcarbamoyladenosine dehydratase [Pseudorhodoferax sp.]